VVVQQAIRQRRVGHSVFFALQVQSVPLSAEGILFGNEAFLEHELVVISQQNGEARRLIVLVIRERLGDAWPAHHLEEI
jgi:hypothetical protein